MVLLEIDKKYPHNERLLGEHRWSEFLRNPSEEEEDRVTQIFHSLYTTGRAAQKDGTRASNFPLLPAHVPLLGWKRIHVEGSWFKDWSSDNLYAYFYETSRQSAHHGQRCQVPIPWNPLVPDSTRRQDKQAAVSSSSGGGQASTSTSCAR
jgi:hypothetical protein